MVWSTPVPPKVLAFSWRLATDSLATWCNKNKQALELQKTCPVCGMEDEDSFHVMCACDNAKNLWYAMSSVWSLPELTSIHPTHEWFLNLLCEHGEDTRVRLMMLLWRIWYVRNEVVHAKPAPPVEVSVRFLSSYLASLQALELDSNEQLKG